MKLTPLDIKRHSFEKGFRGYDPAEVDGFLKQIADQFESLQEELRLAHERTRETEAKLQHYERVEMALQEALESAKASAKRSEEDASRRSAVIIEEAELRAQQILLDVERERFGMRQDLVRLSSRQAEVAARLRGFLMSELEVLSDFQGSVPAGLLQMDESPMDTFEPLQISQEASSPDDSADSSGASASGGDAAPSDDEGALDAPTHDGFDLPAPGGADSLDETPSSRHAPTTGAATPTVESQAAGQSAIDPADDSPAPTATPRVEISSRAGEDQMPPLDSEVLGPPTPIVSDDVPLSSGGWSVPADTNMAGTEAERERIRRILEDLD